MSLKVYVLMSHFCSHLMSFRLSKAETVALYQDRPVFSNNNFLILKNNTLLNFQEVIFFFFFFYVLQFCLYSIQKLFWLKVYLMCAILMSLTIVLWMREAFFRSQAVYFALLLLPFLFFYFFFEKKKKNKIYSRSLL